MRPIPVLALFALFVACFARAQETVPAAPKTLPCTAPQYRQFDFWLGDWNVANAAGKAVGQNRLVSLHGGCAMLESWTGSGAVTGSSLSAYDADLGHWHQTWMDSGGGVLHLDGHLAGGSMILEGDSYDRATQKTTRNRVTWTPLADGRVRQWWQQSAMAERPGRRRSTATIRGGEHHVRGSEHGVCAGERDAILPVNAESFVPVDAAPFALVIAAWFVPPNAPFVRGRAASTQHARGDGRNARGRDAPDFAGLR